MYCLQKTNRKVLAEFICKHKEDKLMILCTVSTRSDHEIFEICNIIIIQDQVLMNWQITASPSPG